MAGDEGNALDLLLDAGAAPLQYFRMMLDLAKVISPRPWPDWREHVCRSYDNERGIDLAALRGDAALLRAQATAARQAHAEQATARGQVQAAWPDSAGQAALATLDAHQRRGEPVAAALEATAKAAEGVPGALTAAVAAKIRKLSEFSQSGTPFADALLGASVPGVLPGGIRPDPVLIARFEQQLARDLAQFDRIIAETVAAVRAAYDAVPAAAVADASPFPAPAFAQIAPVATAPPAPAPAPGATTTAPATTGPGPGGGRTDAGGTVGGGSRGGGGLQGGGALGGALGGGAPRAGAPDGRAPGGGSEGAGPAGAGSGSGRGDGPAGAATPAAAPSAPGRGTPGATPASTNPAGGAPGANPLSGLGGQAGGMPSWLQQLLPKIAEQLGLDKTDGKPGTDGKEAPGKPGEKSGDKPGEKAGEKGDAKDKPGLTDAAGRKVTAALSPDGKTVDVKVTNPDGTEQRATLRVGEDGKLTCVEPGKGAGPVATDERAKGATPSTSPDKPGAASPEKPAPEKPAPPAPDKPAHPAAEKAGPAPAVEKAGPAPSPAPAQPTPAPVPAVPKAGTKSGGATQAAPAEPCPPEQQGSGAQFAITVP